MVIIKYILLTWVALDNLWIGKRHFVRQYITMMVYNGYLKDCVLYILNDTYSTLILCIGLVLCHYFCVSNIFC